jgi:hypothetical protein
LLSIKAKSSFFLFARQKKFSGIRHALKEKMPIFARKVSVMLSSKIITKEGIVKCPFSEFQAHGACPTPFQKIWHRTNGTVQIPPCLLPYDWRSA